MLASSLLLAAALSAPDPCPGFALVLSGGGARGLAHVGVLRALEEAGLRPGCVVGNSMGAVVGALYASGLAPAEIEARVRSIDWDSVFTGRAERGREPAVHRFDEQASLASVGLGLWEVRLPPGAVPDYRVQSLLTRWLAAPSAAAGDDFDRLPIPFRAVAGDLETGERVVLSRGHLPRAVRASMAVPLVFSPVSWEGRVLVDGLIVDNLPVGVARDLGAGRVLAVDIGSPPLARERWRTAVGVANQVTDVLARARYAAHAAPADVTLKPELGSLSGIDYGRFEEAIRAGRQAVEAALPVLRERFGGGQVLPPVEVPEDPLAGRNVTAVEVVGNARVREDLVRGAFVAGRGAGPFALDAALRGLDAVQAQGLFFSSWLEPILEPDGGLRLRVHVEEREPLSLDLGLAFDEQDRTRLWLRLRQRNLFGFGERGELTLVESEAERGLTGSLVDPRLGRGPLGAALRLRYLDERPRFFDAEGAFLNRAAFDRREAALSVFPAWRLPVLARVGLTVSRVEVSGRAGVPIPASDDTTVRLTAGVLLDRLDAPGPGQAGFRLDARVERSFADGPRFTRGQVRAQAALRPARRLRLELRGQAAFATGEVPEHELWRLGGPLLLPGLQRDELWGRAVAAGAVAGSVQVGRFRTGVRLGAGNVWRSWDGASPGDLRAGLALEVAIATPLGPIQASVAAGSEGRQAAYLTLGWR